MKGQCAHDRILRCRINAAFRSQVERRIYAAERVPEEICPAPKDNEPKPGSSNRSRKWPAEHAEMKWEG